MVNLFTAALSIKDLELVPGFCLIILPFQAPPLGPELVRKLARFHGPEVHPKTPGQKNVPAFLGMRDELGEQGKHVDPKAIKKANVILGKVIVILVL